MGDLRDGAAIRSFNFDHLFDHNGRWPKLSGQIGEGDYSS